MCAANRFRTRLGQPDVAYVAFRDHLGDRTHRFLDRHIRIDAGETIDVDVVRAEAAQRVREEILHRIWAAVVAQEGALRIAQRTELDAEHHLAPVAVRERVA